MNEVLGWFGSLMETLINLFPRRVIVNVTEGGVKFVGGKKVVPFGPGIVWYWPFWTEIKKIITAEQPVNLEDQTLVTSDGQTVKVGAVLIYEVVDVVKALAENGNVDELIVNECMAAVQQMVSKRTFEEIKNGRAKIEKVMTGLMQKKLDRYGVKVYRSAITEFAKTRSIHISGIYLGHNNE